MSRRPILTAEHLQDAGACPEQVALFLQTFPYGATMTVVNITRARAAGLRVGWCEALLDQPARAEYLRAIAPTRAGYRRAAASALAEYARAVASTGAEYACAVAPARAERDRATASAEAKYDRATAPAWAEYLRAADRALLAGLVATFVRRQQEGGAA